MSEKRKRDPSDPQSAAPKRAKRGFKVGPDNLPDGAYKRKNQKLKSSLIERARLYKSYSKVKQSLPDADASSNSIPQPASFAEPQPPKVAEEPSIPVSVDPHPDRQQLISEEAINPTADPAQNGPSNSNYDRARGNRERRKKKGNETGVFQKEVEAAKRRREEMEQRREERERREKERGERIEERQRFQREMAKARRPGVDGKRKLGRESRVLLAKVKKMVGA